MKNGTGGCTRLVCAVLALMTVASVSALSQQIDLKRDPAKPALNFSWMPRSTPYMTLFRHSRAPAVRSCFWANLRSNSGGRKGDVTGNGMRDRKMHKDVRESKRYLEISFLPDGIDGAVAHQGKSSVGMFRIHGVEREIRVPAQV